MVGHPMDDMCVVKCRYSLVAEHLIGNEKTRVRFPVSAPFWQPLMILIFSNIKV